MKVIVQGKSKKSINSIRTKLNSSPNILYIRNLQDNYLAVYYKKKVYAHQHHLIKTIEKTFKKFHNIKYTLYPTTISDAGSQTFEKEGYKPKYYHFFLDIDHTITDNKKGEFDNRARRAFKEMKTLGHVIHYATGRDHLDVLEKIETFKVSPRAIAENGGIILGLTNKPFFYGDIDGPREALSLLRAEFDDIEIDESQNERKTEIVIKRNHDVEEIIEVVKGLATVLQSKRAIHLTEPGVDKGTAMMHLANESPDIEDDKIIAIGDSHLDAPMLKNAHIGFALKNSDKYAMEAADIIMTGGKFFDGVLYAFYMLDKRFNLNSYKIRYND